MVHDEGIMVLGRALGRLTGRMRDSLVLVLLLALPAIFSAALADASGKAPDTVTALFSEHDPQSTIKLDHGMWSRFLSKTVLYAGYSTRRIGRARKRTWVGSQMGYGNNLPSRYENNRVILSGFEDDYLAVIRQYRKALEALPEQAPLNVLNRDEQLAYWLNLYNVHALEHVAAHYPATTTETLRSAPGEMPKGVWHERTLKVAGISLSLVDIERKILFPIWDNPILIYGLWQGAIGGPRLPLRAYTSATVHRMLRENAREFVNSNRGMEPDGKVLKVSVLYGWAEPLFDSKQNLREHILTHAAQPFSLDVEATRRVVIDLYDWHLADLSGGTHHQGQWNHTAGFVFGLPANDTRAQALANQVMARDMPRGALPPQSIELLEKMARFNNRSRRTRIRIRDCPAGTECPAAADAQDRQSKEIEADIKTDAGDSARADR